MQADTPEVEQEIQRALAFQFELELCITAYTPDLPPLTVTDARRIVECTRENPRFETLSIHRYALLNADVLDVFRNGLPLCTTVISVSLHHNHLTNQDLDRLRPAFYNTSVRILSLCGNCIQGKHGGEVLRDLFVGNTTLEAFDLSRNTINPECATGLGKGLAGSTNRLQKLYLYHCSIGNAGLANLLLSMSETNNTSLLHLDLSWNRIEGEEGGRQVTLLLQRFSSLKLLKLDNNNLGPLGARALATGLAAEACNLEELGISHCGLGNDGVANLVPADGQVNRSLTRLILGSNNIQGVIGGEILLALASRCTNLDSINVDRNIFTSDQRRRFHLLLDRKQLHIEAQGLGGFPPSVVFQKLIKANAHEQGLSAAFLILRDYIFAEQQHTTSISSGGEGNKAHAGVKRKRAST